MRLSDAVLLGLPEIRFTNSVWLGEDTDGNCFGCLVGAALFSIGARRGEYDIDQQLAQIWTWTKTYLLEGALPCCGREFNPMEITCVLTHMADHYKDKEITAEFIADWVRSVEPQEEPVRDPEAEFMEQRAGLNEPAPEEPEPTVAEAFIEQANKRMQRNSWSLANHGTALVIDALRKNGDVKP